MEKYPFDATDPKDWTSKNSRIIAKYFRYLWTPGFKKALKRAIKMARRASVHEMIPPCAWNIFSNIKPPLERIPSVFSPSVLPSNCNSTTDPTTQTSALSPDQPRGCLFKWLGHRKKASF